MGKRLKEKNVVIDLMVTSPAKRALATSKPIAEILSYPDKTIVLEEKLYHATEDKMLDIVHRLNDNHDTIMIFGHNPGLTDFVNSLVNGHIANVPTCGIVACNFSVDSWKNIKWGSGKLIFYDYPKSQAD